ncbi:MAG: PAS domain S-box protein [Cyanobacteria bacterium P01_G01_bin.54]
MTVSPSADPELFRWLQQAPVALLVLDQQMGYVAASQRWHQLYQVPESVPPQTPLSELWPGCPVHWRAVHQQALQGKSQFQSAEQLAIAPQQTLTVQWEAQPWQGEDGRILGVLWVTHPLSTAHPKMTHPETTSSEAAPTLAALAPLVEQSIHFMALLTPRGHLLTVNRTTLDTAGLDGTAIRGSLLWELPWWEMTVSTCAQLKGSIAKAANGEAVQREVALKRQGQEQAVDFVFLPIASPDGKITYLLAEGRDLSTQKSVEQALSRSERMFKAARQLAQIGSWEWDILTGEVIWSPETFTLYGLEPEPMPLSFERQLSYVHPDDRQRFYSTLYETLYREQPYRIEFRVVRQPKEQPEELSKEQIVHLFAQGEPVRNEQGDVTHLFGTLLDISERKQVELRLQQEKADLATLVDQFSEQLTENAAEYQAVFEYAGIGLNYIDRQGRILRANPHCCELLGYSEAELLELTMQDLTHPEDLAQDRHLQHQILTGQRTNYILEKRCLRKDGNPLWVRVHRTAVRDRHGRTRYLIGVIQDISLAKTTESELRNQAVTLKHTVQELRLTQDQLVQTEQLSSLGQLVAGVAHEINNPVNFIYGNLSHASDYVHDLMGLVQLYQKHHPCPHEDITAEQEAIDLEFLVEDLPQIFTSMQIGADRIKEIVASLRHFSRRDEATMKSVDLREGIESTLMILHNRLKPRAESPGIKLIKKYEAELPKVTCYAGQLNQVFMNLLGNAIDALEERDRDRTYAEIEAAPSTITITTSLAEQQVTISVHDNGPGIPAQIQTQLFEPFFTTKPVGKGTGLGLAISYQIIVEKHQGQLLCDSSPEAGTTFKVIIPLQQPDPNP